MARWYPPEHRSTGFADWPAEDQTAWRNAERSGNLLFDAGRGAHWADDTRSRYQWTYGHWLTFLRTSGRWDPSAAACDRVAVDALAAFVDSLHARGLSGSTVKSYIEALHNAVWAMFPDRDWSWLRARVNLLARQARPAKAATAREWPMDEVYQAALAEMDRAERMTPARRLRDSVHFRDGLMVAVLVATWIRRRNFAELEIGRHLTREADGYRIVVPSAQVKNKQHIEGLLPSSLTPYMERYLDHHRPRLLNGEPHDRLWLNEDGSAFTANTVTRRITKVTAKLGFPMNPHQFRNSNATHLATVRPDLARTAGQLLGHRSHRTAERYYNRAQMIHSSVRHCDSLNELRKSLPKPDDKE